MLAWSGEPVLWTLANHIGMVQVLWGFRISWKEASSNCAYGILSRASLVIDSYSLHTISSSHCFQKHSPNNRGLKGSFW